MKTLYVVAKGRVLWVTGASFTVAASPDTDTEMHWRGIGVRRPSCSVIRGPEHIGEGVCVSHAWNEVWPAASLAVNVI